MVVGAVKGVEMAEVQAKDGIRPRSGLRMNGVAGQTSLVQGDGLGGRGQTSSGVCVCSPDDGAQGGEFLGVSAG